MIKPLVVVLALPLILMFASIHISTTMAASTINVPADQSTIQAAIDVASAGDTVVVAPGTSAENINYHGKAIEVRSAAGPSLTVIDASGSQQPVVNIISRETPPAGLRGFTVLNVDESHDTEHVDTRVCTICSSR